jgi:pimeloyl-ACP methyl ester carboxylesterase
MNTSTPRAWSPSALLRASRTHVSDLRGVARIGNPLGLEMELRFRGRRIEPEDPSLAFAAGPDAAPTGRLVLHNWPRPVEELVILGHSMGGLVARSACHHGRAAEHAWTKHLRKVVFLGTLRHGSLTTDPDDFVPLPEGVHCYAAAATLAERRSVVAERLLGDGLVPLDSSLGRHSDPARTLALPKQRQ